MGPDVWLLLGAGIVIAAIVAVRVVHRSGLPSLLIFLGFGLIVGESGFGLQFENPQLAQEIGLIALAIILAEGGLTTTWSHVKGAIPTALVLATVGVGVSIVAVAVPVGARPALGAAPGQHQQAGQARHGRRQHPRHGSSVGFRHARTAVRRAGGRAADR